MNRRTAEILLVAAVAVVVVSIAASTLDSTASRDGGTGLGGTNESGNAIFPDVSTNTSAAVGGITPPRNVMLVVVVLGSLAALWYLWKHPRESLGILVAMAVIFVGLLVITEFLSDLFGDTSGKGSDGLMGGGFGVSGGSIQGPEGAQLPVESLDLLAVLAFGIVLVGVVLWISEDPSDRDLGGNSSESVEGIDVETIGRAAGEAADRIEADAAVDNEVYRAWVEMTDLLEVPHPETSTPEDFAAAAVDAGMDRDDVEELTTLFRAVRYGPEDPTAGHEERAVDALRRIESTYAPGHE